MTVQPKLLKGFLYTWTKIQTYYWLYNVQKWAKLIYGNRSQESGYFWEVMTGRNYMEGLGDTNNILLFELNIGNAALFRV